MELSILPWRTFAMLFKDGIEATQGAKAGFEGDVKNLLLCADEKSLSMGETMVKYIFHHRLPEHFAKQSHCITTGQSRGVADLGDG